MGCCGCLCKCFGETLLVILNSLTILVGILVTSLGVLFTLYWQLPGVGQYLTDLLQLHVDPNIPNLTEIFREMSDTMEIVGYVISGIGLLLLIGGILGCCSAMCHNRCLMATYGITLGIISVTLITGSIVVAIDHQIVIRPVEHWMYERVQNEFTDPLNNLTHSTPVGYSATVIMLDLQCCGVRNYTEFETCKRWDKQYSYNNVSVEAVVPSACCKNVQQWNSTAQYESNCLNEPNSQNSNIDTPCFPIINTHLETAIVWSLSVLGGIGGLLAFLFVYTIALVCIYTRRNVRRQYKDAADRFQHYVYPNAAYTEGKI